MLRKDNVIRILFFILIFTALGFISYWINKFGVSSVDTQFLLLAILVGFIAQIVDGAIGMAYGLTSTSFLLLIGATPATASAATHVAEAFTTGASGLSHWKLNNIDKKLFQNLLIPGIVGAIIGVFFITYIDGKFIRPFVSAYLLLLGIFILVRAFKKITLVDAHNDKIIPPLGLFGAFIDSVGGGGWGPVVTTSLVASGRDPRTTIGSVNAAEFFVTLASGFSFILLLGIQHWEAVAGLIIGGLIAAPFAAFFTSKIPQKKLLILVGCMIIFVSAYNIYASL